MRVRYRFTKLGKVRFVGHRDVARLWERAIRVAAVPVAVTEGFHPRPKVHFGLALSVGYESDGEYIDVDLRADVAPTDFDIAGSMQQLSNALPPGVDVVAAGEVDRADMSLQQAVVATTWRLWFVGTDRAVIAGELKRLLDAEALPATVVRKGKDVLVDVRPLIESWQVDAEPVVSGTASQLDRLGPSTTITLATRPRAVRVAEIVALLEPTPDDVRVRRLSQLIVTDDERGEPLPLAR